jgi:hypothetical protein
VTAAAALRAWAESKPGVSRITPRQLGRGERGPFGRYRGGDFGPSPFEIRYGLAEGVEDSCSPVTTISRPLPDDCAALRAFLTCEIPAPLPPWERAERINKLRRQRMSGPVLTNRLRLASQAALTSRQAAAALLGTCETCAETPGPDQDEPIHQPWCPEVGGWWCNACQAWSARASCDTCERPRAEAEVWSPYTACPACGGELDRDPQGEPASCQCGWREGE